MAGRVIPFAVKPGALVPRRAAERAFLPAALEIIETPASPTLRFTAGVIGLFVVSAVGWSYFGQVDIVATASGKVIVQGRTKVIQPSDVGVVRAIHVADGDHVEAGQVLIELDPAISAADQVRYAEQLTQAHLDQARLRELLEPSSADPFITVQAAPDLVMAARARLEAEKREQTAKMAKLDHATAEKVAARAGIDAQIAKIDAALPFVGGRASIREQGVQTQFGSKLDYYYAEQQLVEMQHERVVQQRKLDEVDAALTELVAGRAQSEAEFKRRVLEDLAKANHDAAAATGELAKAEKKIDLQTLTAPVAGVVQDLAVHTLGGVVTPAQQLLRLVPLDGGIEIAAAVSNQDVGFVSVGQEAEVKIDTFPFTRYGLIHGRVRSIARDAVEDLPGDQRRQGSQDPSDIPSNVERSRLLVYTARISLEETALSVDGKVLELAPGMAITAEIKTGKRSILDYLLSPFHRYTHDALRER